MSKIIYQSCRGGGEITAAQLIMEHFLLLLAQQEGSVLPQFFWKLDKYKKLWKRHVRSVHARLKEYDVDAIRRGLQDRKLRKLRSLSDKAAWLWKPTFDKYQRIVNQEKLARENYRENHVEETNVEINPNIRREQNTSKTNLQSLKDLDK